MGIEPTTYALRVRCSTIELSRRYLLYQLLARQSFSNGGSYSGII